MGEDRDVYFLRRFEDEVAAAEAASCEEARVAHLELALRYSMLTASAQKHATGIEDPPTPANVLLSAASSA
jgi:hypothetical protein